MGAAYGTLVAGLISGSISFMVSQKYYKINWEYRKIVLILAIFFMATLSTMFLRGLTIDYIYRLVFKILFVLLCIFV